MGQVLTPVPFFTDDITIEPTASTNGNFLGRPVSVREFSDWAWSHGYRRGVGLYKVEDSDVLVVRAYGLQGRHRFMEGREV